MSANYASTSRAAQKEVEVMSFENVVDIWLTAASTSKEVVKSNKKPEEGCRNDKNNKKVINKQPTVDAVVCNFLQSGGELMVYETEKETTRSTEVVAHLPIIQTAEKSAEAVVVKSNKKPTEDCHPKKIRNDKNKKRVIKKEQPVVAMKCLGSKRTLIKMSEYKKIKWGIYTKATRQLLIALFPRKVLASHSLSGKQSPAFQNKPAKPSLDADIISDIIETVCRECDVKENLVRHVITIKCADEAKMLRLRENKAKRRVNRPQEI